MRTRAIRSAFRVLPATLGLTICVVVLGGCAGPTRDVAGFTFFAIGDPQINIPKWGTAGVETSIDRMNDLPGQPFPLGGTVAEPRGVLIAGDLVDDVRNPANWARYCEFFDVHGRGRLRFPVLEGLGNHDLDSRIEPGGWSDLQRAFQARSASRRGAFAYGPHGYHYSWDWGRVHFVCLNIFPGNKPRPVYGRQARWNDPRHSLDFLVEDLRARVGASGRPVLLMWHYGLRGWGLDKWWTKADLERLDRELAPYNIALILHGHEHRYERYRWRGRDVVMAPAPQSVPDPKTGAPARDKGFLVVRVTADELQLAHHHRGAWRATFVKPL